MTFCKRVQVAGIAGAVCVLAAGCIFNPGSGGGGGPTHKILPRTSPENVVNNIAAVYELRDVTQYDSLLTDAYVFRFQEADIRTGAPDSIGHAQEILFAEKLFVSGAGGENPAASRITFSYTISAIGDDPRLGHTGWKRYTVQTTVKVGFSNGNEIEVNSPAEFYFKQDPEGSGLWRLAEWRDLPGGTGAPRLLALK